MKIFGRKYNFNELIIKIIDLSKMFFRSLIFKDFILLWIAYIRQNSPKSNMIITRDGYKIFLSKNPHDTITVMVIFCRQEYGKIIPGSTIIDVGANIGAFSMYAARCGAKKVYAFEPNKESFDVLSKNIKENNLENTVIPYNLAVGPIDGEFISIPKESSPYNKTYGNLNDQTNYDIVETISLHTFINKNDVKKIDFLKMDCEGAEYQIMYPLGTDDLKLISNFRLENHDSHEKENLIAFLRKNGLMKTHEKHLIMWFERI